MNTRRFHERPLRLVHVRPADPGDAETSGTWRHDGYRLDPQAESWVSIQDPVPEPGERAAVLLELYGGRALLLAPSPVTPVPLDGPGRLSDAAALAADAERGLRRDLDRLRRYERFIVLADLLAAAESPSDVFGALGEHLASIIDAWVTVVFRQESKGGTGRSAILRPLPASGLRLERFALEVTPDAPLPHLGLLSWNEPPEPGDPFAPLRTIFEATPVRHMAYAAINGDAIVLVADRRSDREFGAQDWDLLRVAIRQAEAALRRLG